MNLSITVLIVYSAVAVFYFILGAWFGKNILNKPKDLNTITSL